MFVFSSSVPAVAPMPTGNTGTIILKELLQAKNRCLWHKWAHLRKPLHRVVKVGFSLALVNKPRLGVVLNSLNLNTKRRLHCEYLRAAFAELNDGPLYTVFPKVPGSRRGLGQPTSNLTAVSAVTRKVRASPTILRALVLEKNRSDPRERLLSF